MRMIRLRMSFALLVVTAHSAFAAHSANAQPAAVAVPLAAEAFFREADIAEAVLSPSGQRLAITSGRGGMRVGLFVIDLGKAAKPRPVAQYEAADIEVVRWVDDDILIFSATDYSRGSGSPDGWPGL